MFTLLLGILIGIVLVAILRPSEAERRRREEARYWLRVYRNGPDD
jgi:hypothetical protein